MEEGWGKLFICRGGRDVNCTAFVVYAITNRLPKERSETTVRPFSTCLCGPSVSSGDHQWRGRAGRRVSTGGKFVEDL